MDKQDNIDIWDLCKTVSGLPWKFINAAIKGLQESDNLTCVKDQQLDFYLIENDVRKIHETLTFTGSKVLASRVILDEKEELIQIKTYTEKDNKTYCNTANAKFRRVINIPEDIVKELQKQGRIELNLRL